MSERVPTVLSIAGSDSGGGAGIQADLKAFARCGVHGTTAITAITAQNTVGVTGVEPVSPAMIVEQVRAVADDIGVDAVKIGMLGTAETIAAVVEALDLVGDAPVVVDPVMVAESGAVLLDEDARAALARDLLPLAAVATPNIPEARVLTGLGEDASQDGAGGCRAGARAGRRRRHRRPQRDPDRRLLRRRPRRSRSPASGIRAGPRTAPAAPTPRRSPRTSPSGSRRSTRPARRSGSPPRRSPPGCRASAPGPGRSTRSGRMRPLSARPTGRASAE